MDIIFSFIFHLPLWIKLTNSIVNHRSITLLTSTPNSVRNSVWNYPRDINKIRPWIYSFVVSLMSVFLIYQPPWEIRESRSECLPLECQFVAHMPISNSRRSSVEFVFVVFGNMHGHWLNRFIQWNCFRTVTCRWRLKWSFGLRFIVT